MQILSLLSTLADIELEMSGLYSWLAEVFAEDGEAAGLFFRLSLQERSHYNLVRFGKRLVHSNPNEFARVPVDGRELFELRDTIGRFRTADPPPLEDAVRFALEIERQAGENIHRRVIVESNPKLMEMIRNLATSDADHLRVLEEFARDRFGGAAAP
jgi:hypothetical protein